MIVIFQRRFWTAVMIDFDLFCMVVIFSFSRLLFRIGDTG
jgi:hypothetical protein